jgi:hypothetical protein
MILNGTATNLNPNFARGHDDWASRFQAVPQIDQDEENEQMEDIVNLLSSIKSCSEAQAAALVNNEETIVFIGLDASKENFFLVHNLEVIPSSRHQAKPIIRALHGCGAAATAVILDYNIVMDMNEIHCASIANIRKFSGFANIQDTMVVSNQSLLKSRGLVALPPFISSKLMALPSLAVDDVLTSVIKTIREYDRKIAEKEGQAIIDLEKEEEDEKKKEPAPSKDELTDDPVQEDSDDDEPSGDSWELPDKPEPLFASLLSTSSKKKSQSKVAFKEPSLKPSPLDAPIPRKPHKQSTSNKCGLLFRFLWTAAWQLRFPNGGEEDGDEKKPFLPTIPMFLTVGIAHSTWCSERHSRNNVGLQWGQSYNPLGLNNVNAAAAAPTASTTPEQAHLARKTTSALESISATFQVMAAAGTGTSSSQAPDKVHPKHLQMIERLCTVDGVNTRPPTKFFSELSTASGKAGTGAILQWNLHMSLNSWNIRVSPGCITALARGAWAWDRANFPNNLTIFAFPRITANDYNKSQNEASQNIHLRANVGNTLSEKDVKLLSHQGMSYTPDVGETIKQMKNFAKCLDALIHPDSMLTINYRAFISYVEDNEEVYEANQAMDALFCLKLLYKVDLIRNRMVQQCLVQPDFIDVDWNRCDFYQIHATVMDGNFQQLLPSNLGIPDASASSSNSTSKRNKSASDDGGNATSTKKPKADSPRMQTKDAKEKGNLLINPDWLPSLKLTPTEDYGKLFVIPKKLQHMPKLANSQHTLCANWHINGKCYSKCERKETHQKLTPDVARATEAWLKKCRTDAA